MKPALLITRTTSLPSSTTAHVTSVVPSIRPPSKCATGIPVAHFEGGLMLGTTEVTCAVVEDGSDVVRVINSAGFMRALGRPWKGSYERTGRPNFLEANNLQPFITSELEDVLNMYE